MKLSSLNRVLRFFGFVLVVESGEGEPTLLYFQRAARWPLLPE